MINRELIYIQEKMNETKIHKTEGKVMNTNTVERNGMGYVFAAVLVVAAVVLTSLTGIF